MKFRYLDNVVTLELDMEACIGCGMCLKVCPHGVFVMNEKAKLKDRDLCMECGACARNCPVEAIRVKTGVGCAAGILGSMLGLKGFCSECQCSDNEDSGSCC